MHCHPLEDGIKLLYLHPVWGILFILRGNIPGGPGHARFLVLGALQNHLYSIAFLCHDAIPLAIYLMSIPFCFASFITAEIPFLFMAFKARVETLRVTHRSSSGM